MSPELPWQFKQMSGIHGSCRPFHTRSVLVELRDIGQPLRSRLGGYDDDIGNVARADTTADRKMYTFQQTSPAPFFSQPVGRNFRAALLCRSATAPLTNDHLPYYPAVCFQAILATLGNII